MINWIEGFERYGTADSAPSGLDLDYAVTNSSLMTLRSGRLAGCALEIAAAASIGSIVHTFSSVITPISFGFAFKYAWTSATGTYQMAYLPSISHWVGVNRATGYLTNGYTGDMTSAPIVSGRWYYVEVLAAASAITVYLNGVQVGTATLARGTTASFTLQGATTGTVLFDDFYSGSAILGPQRVQAFSPIGDGDSSGWTPSAGASHYPLVSENPSDGDTSYVNTTSGLDLWTYGATADGTINGVQINTIARTEDNSTSLYLPVKRSSTQNDGTAQTVSSASFKNYSRIVETDPVTSAAWTQSGLASAQFGVKV